jgi:hypothetical protein
LLNSIAFIFQSNQIRNETVYNNNVVIRSNIFAL